MTTTLPYFLGQEQCIGLFVLAIYKGQYDKE